MRRTTTILMALLLAGGAFAPLASAGWKYRGTNEPDTAMDIGWMYTTSDTSANPNVQQIYFNGYAHVAELWVNPNLGVTGSRLQPGAEISLSAMLGVWKDCNADGYIGFGEPGLMEYRSTLLLEQDICPPQVVTPGAPPAVYPFNDGSWVREFRWIGTKHALIGGTPANPTITVVPGTQVWFDWGLPNAAPGTTCPTTAVNLRSVGGFLEWTDCFTRYQVVRNLNSVDDASGGLVPVGGWDMSDIEHSENTLNVQNPAWTPLYGADGDGWGEGAMGRDNYASGERPDRMVEVWDCSDNANPAPGSGNVNPDGSAYEVVNETQYIAQKQDCKSTTSPDGSNQAAPYPYPDSPAESTNADSGKDEVSDLFIFGAGTRRGVQGGAGVLGPYAPADMGLGLERDLDTIGPSWRSNTLWGRDPQLVNRDGLDATGAIYFTFYAKLGADPGVIGASVAKSGVETYGPCAGATSGKVNGWKCDPNEWEATCIVNGADTRSCVKVGAEFHMRDVDCWDGRILAGAPVYASLAQISNGGPCADGLQTGLEP